MKIKEAINYLQLFGIKLSAAGLRAAIRRGELGEIEKNADQSEFQIPSSKLLDYALAKTNNKYYIYQAGFENGRRFYEKNLIHYDIENGDKQTFLIEASLPNQYHYLVNNSNDGFSRYLLEIDSSKGIFHLRNDLSEGGTSAINQINENLLYDILTKVKSNSYHYSATEVRLFVYTGPTDSFPQNVDFSTFGYDKDTNTFNFHILEKEEALQSAHTDFLNFWQN